MATKLSAMLTLALLMSVNFCIAEPNHDYDRYLGKEVHAQVGQNDVFGFYNAFTNDTLQVGEATINWYSLSMMEPIEFALNRPPQDRGTVIGNMVRK